MFSSFSLLGGSRKRMRKLYDSCMGLVKWVHGREIEREKREKREREKERKREREREKERKRERERERRRHFTRTYVRTSFSNTSLGWGANRAHFIQQGSLLSLSPFLLIATSCLLKLIRELDRRTDGQTDGRTDKETNRQTDRRACRDSTFFLSILYPSTVRV